VKGKLGWALVTVGAAVGLTGCGISVLGGTPAKHAPKPIRPAYIVPTAKGSLAETAPSVQGVVWVLAGSTTAKALYQVSLSSRKIVGSVSVTGAATSVALSPTGQLALGAGSGNVGFVQFLDSQTGSVQQTVPLGGAVRCLVASADGSTFYALDVTSKSASVSLISAQTGKVTSTLPAALDAVSIVPTPDGSGIYYLEPNGNVSEIATVGGQVETTFSVGTAGRSLAISPDGSTLYVLKGTAAQTNIAVVDLATQGVKRALPAAADSAQIAISPNGTDLYDLVGTPTLGNLQAVKIPS